MTIERYFYGVPLPFQERPLRSSISRTVRRKQPFHTLYVLHCNPPFGNTVSSPFPSPRWGAIVNAWLYFFIPSLPSSSVFHYIWLWLLSRDTQEHIFPFSISKESLGNGSLWNTHLMEKELRYWKCTVHRNTFGLGDQIYSFLNFFVHFRQKKSKLTVCLFLVSLQDWIAWMMMMILWA